jgi:hypothetical protein
MNCKRLHGQHGAENMASNKKGHDMTQQEKIDLVRKGLDFVHEAIRKAMNGDTSELVQAEYILELMKGEA